MPRWRNWQTRHLEVVVSKDLRVQVPPWAQIDISFKIIYYKITLFYGKVETREIFVR